MIASGNHLGQSSADTGEGQSARLAAPARARLRGPQAERLCEKPNQGPPSLGDARVDGLPRQSLVSPDPVGAADQNRAAAGADNLPARSRDRSLQANHRDRLLGVLGLGRGAGTMERSEAIGASRTAAIMCARSSFLVEPVCIHQIDCAAFVTLRNIMALRVNSSRFPKIRPCQGRQIGESIRPDRGHP